MMHIIFSLAFCGYSSILVQRDYKNLEILCYKKLQYIIIYNQLIFLLYIMREYGMETLLPREVTQKRHLLDRILVPMLCAIDVKFEYCMLSLSIVVTFSTVFSILLSKQLDSRARLTVAIDEGTVVFRDDVIYYTTS